MLTADDYYVLVEAFPQILLEGSAVMIVFLNFISGSLFLTLHRDKPPLALLTHYLNIGYALKIRPYSHALNWHSRRSKSNRND